MAIEVPEMNCDGNEEEERQYECQSLYSHLKQWPPLALFAITKITETNEVEMAHLLESAKARFQFPFLRVPIRQKEMLPNV